jgi:N-acetylmuramoyl-L-alanine amidase CwlD
MSLFKAFWNLRLKVAVPCVTLNEVKGLPQKILRSAQNDKSGTEAFSLRFLSICVILFSLSSFSFAAEKNTILSIESAKMGDYAEITVNTSLKVKPEVITLDSPNRIALVFHDSVIPAPMTVASKSHLINIIQAMQFDENTVYVMIEPTEELSYDFTSFIGRNRVMLELSRARAGAKKRIAPSPAQKTIEERQEYQVITEEVIETEVITEEISEPEQIIAAPEETPAPVPAPVKISKPVRPENLIPVAKLPVREIKEIRGQAAAPVVAAPVIVPTSNDLKGMVIIVDPGHGGKDPGYVGLSGILEKNMTLKVALELKKMLDASGAKVIMTRSGDKFVSNKKKVAAANAKKASLYVAIHFNSFPSPRIRGCETFYFSKKSKAFARIMEKCAVSTAKFKNRGTRKFAYYVIHKTLMPSVLIEAGYLTNPDEERLISTPEYRKNIALGIYKGIMEYAKMKKYGRNIASTPHSI